jgi:hypothetical protein
VGRGRKMQISRAACGWARRENNNNIVDVVDDDVFDDEEFRLLPIPTYNTISHVLTR